MKKINLYIKPFDKKSPVLIRDLESVLIKMNTSEYLKQKVNSARSFLLQGKKHKYNQLKKSLPAVTVCGTFSPSRKSNYIKDYSGLVVIDYDEITKYELQKIRKILTKTPWIYSFFLSPSGKGIKVICHTSNKDPKQHYHAIKHCWKSLLEQGIHHVPDKSGSDVARLCFLSYDENLYINPNCETLFIPIEKSYSNRPRHIKDIFQNNRSIGDIEKYTSNICQFVKGSRNNYLYRFAVNCRKRNISKHQLLAYAHKFIEDDFRISEILLTINSAYNS